MKATKREFLEKYGFVVGARDPNFNRKYPGKFMVIERHEDSEGPTDDGANGPWCIVGDDLDMLIDKAFSCWESEFER